jgi:hypothetical protein
MPRSTMPRSSMPRSTMPRSSTPACSRTKAFRLTLPVGSTTLAVRRTSTSPATSEAMARGWTATGGIAPPTPATARPNAQMRPRTVLVLCLVAFTAALLAPEVGAHPGAPTWSKFKAQRTLRSDWYREFGTRPSVFCRGTRDYFEDRYFRCRISDFQLGAYIRVCLHTRSLFRYEVEPYRFWRCR